MDNAPQGYNHKSQKLKPRKLMFGIFGITFLLVVFGAAALIYHAAFGLPFLNREGTEPIEVTIFAQVQEAAPPPDAFAAAGPQDEHLVI